MALGFFVNVPVGVAAFLFGLVFLQEHIERTASSFDLPGFLLAGIGLALTMYALSEGPCYGWTSSGILACLTIGLIGLTIFVFVELRSTHPILDLRCLAIACFVQGTWFRFSLPLVFWLALCVPLFLQEARGVSALASGLTTFPEALEYWSLLR